MAMNTWTDGLANMLRAGFAGLWIQTSEEARAEGYVLEVARALEYQKILTWNSTHGLIDVSSRTGLGAPDPLEALDVIAKIEEDPLVILEDFHPYLESPVVVRRLRDLLRKFREDGGAVVLLGAVVKVPPEIVKEVHVLDLPLPTGEWLGQMMDDLVAGIAKESKRKVTVPKGEDRVAAIDAAAGLTTIEAESAYTLALVESGRDGKAARVDPAVVQRVKIEAIRKGGILEVLPQKYTLDDVGGLDEMKTWLQKRRRAFTKEAREFGLPMPKGIIAVGPPGTGKSLVAKATAAAWSVPLIRFDVGKVYGSLVGQSEAGMRDAIKTFEAMAPCVGFIDEGEKCFAGSRGGQHDSGVGVRVFGSFLTWMSEKTAPVFIVMTCNDTASLPAELLRKGRFDAIFSVDLPTAEERAQILGIHLSARKRSLTKLEVMALAEGSDGFSGAELEEAVVTGLFEAFALERDLKAEDVHTAIRKTTPLSKSMGDQITRMREWAARYAMPAGKAADESHTVSKRAVRL